MDSNLVWLKCNNRAHLSRLTIFHFLMIFYCKFIWFPLIYYLISHRLFLWKNMNNLVWNYENLALSWQLWEALNISTPLNELHSLITKSQEKENISLPRSYSNFGWQTYNKIYIWCIIDFINQCQPNNFNKK